MMKPVEQWVLYELTARAAQNDSHLISTRPVTAGDGLLGLGMTCRREGKAKHDRPAKGPSASYRHSNTGPEEARMRMIP